MKVLRSATTVLRSASGKILKVRPDTYIEPDPEKLQIQIVVDDNQVFTLPTLNSFSYINNVGSSVSYGTLVYNYIVDWGDGSAQTAITSYNSVDRIHTYVTGGTYLIEISGVFPCWDTNNNVSIKLLITNVISWGNTGLKKINFYGCTSLISLPEQRSKLTGVLTFTNFCYGCAGLTKIPYGIFFGNTIASDFSSVFNSCSKLKVLYSELFRDNSNAYSFCQAFNACVKLEFVPSALFSNCSIAQNFIYLFYQCSTITEAPPLLFTYSTATNCFFDYAFGGCTSLTVIASNIFYHPSTTVGHSMSYTFYGTAIASVPTGLFDNIKISTATRLFYSCQQLTTIPEYLFRYQNLCTTFTDTFYNTPKLTGVPTGVFDLNVGSVNSCTSMQSCFQSSGTGVSVTTFTVADNVFDQLYKVTDFSVVFYGVTKLEVIPNNLFINCVSATTFAQAFSGTKISSIPTGLFSTCTEVVNFMGTFQGCTLLVSSGVPANLFQNCTKVLYFGQNISTYASYTGYGVFANCNNAGFNSIPSGLFDSCTNVVSFYAAFYNTKVASIPTDLLRYNTAVTNVMYMFGATNISSLSANVFAYNISLTTVAYCFNACPLLTSVDENLFNTYNSNPNAVVDFTYCLANCANVGFTAIPANLFRYSINAKVFVGAFSGCTKITLIPDGLFQYNTIAEDFTGCFSSWTASIIPANLFSGLTQIKNVTNCFYFWHELLAIPATLFDSVGLTGAVNYTSCFQIQSTLPAYNKITVAVPELWNKPNSPVGTQCFRNRTAVSNYASIPAAWK